MKYTITLDEEDLDFIVYTFETCWYPCDDEVVDLNYKKSVKVLKKIASSRKAKSPKKAAGGKIDHSGAEAIIARKLGA